MYSSDCEYKCHIFCVEQIKRVCIAVVASENSMISTISPYNGLLSQDYKCAECQSYIRIRNLKISPGNICIIIRIMYELILFLFSDILCLR